MQFARHLRTAVADGSITCTIRVWQRPRVKVDGRYRMAGGLVRVTDLREIAPADVTEELARQSGFDSVAALFALARHGRGDNIYRVDFVYEAAPD